MSTPATTERLAGLLGRCSDFRVKRHEDNPWRYDGTYVCTCGVEFKAAHGPGGSFVAHRAHLAAALQAAGVGFVAEAQAEALEIVRLVERDMAEQALAAWRSADARRGLSDHAALEVHADALTRWSERLRMAMSGEDYRADRIGSGDQ